VTRFALKKAANSSGIAYSQVTFNVDRVLSDAELSAIQPLAEQVKTLSRKVGFDTDEATDSSACVDSKTGEVIVPLG
jgi:hypothetical protein